MTAHGTHETLAVNDVHTYHRNPRRGDVDAIMGSLRVNGQYRPIVVNRGTHTGRTMEVLAGNHTLLAARQLAETDERWSHIDAWVVDVDDDQASRIVLADNRTADLGSYDERTLLDLLDSLDDDLDGTGYLDADRQALLDDYDDEAPDFEPDDDGLSDLDSLEPRPCQNCGYDVANNPEDLQPWNS